MTQSSQFRVPHFLIGVAVLGLAASGGAQAQPTNNSDNQEPWRTPTQAAPAPRPHATSSLEATAPGPQDEHKTRALAAAIFSRPAAAQRAADKASAANSSRITPTDPKPEWLADPPGLHFGGEGLEVNRPF